VAVCVHADAAAATAAKAESTIAWASIVENVVCVRVQV
jgi:hypothetical protein